MADGGTWVEGVVGRDKRARATMVANTAGLDERGRDAAGREGLAEGRDARWNAVRS